MTIGNKKGVLYKNKTMNNRERNAKEVQTMVNRFMLNETSYHGAGAIQEILTEVKARGFKKALIVTDKDLVKFQVVKKVTDLLDGAGYAYAIYDEMCIRDRSTCDPVNDNLMELLIMIDAMKRASAGRINAVIPYYGYARQDRKAKARDPITAKLVADLLVAAGADRVVTMDLHAAQIQGYFDIPVDHLVGMPILSKYFMAKGLEDVVIVSPDHGSVTRARNMAQPLNAPIAIVDKRRPEPNKSEIMNIIGDIEGKNCILVDDMIDTAGTITNAANALKLSLIHI